MNVMHGGSAGEPRMPLQITLCPLLRQSYTDCPQMSHKASFVTAFLKLRHTHTQRMLEVPGLFHVEKEYKAH